jgi:hypothetical protein
MSVAVAVAADRTVVIGRARSWHGFQLLQLVDVAMGDITVLAGQARFSNRISRGTIPFQIWCHGRARTYGHDESHNNKGDEFVATHL